MSRKLRARWRSSGGGGYRVARSPHCSRDNPRQVGSTELVVARESMSRRQLLTAEERILWEPNGAYFYAH